MERLGAIMRALPRRSSSSPHLRLPEGAFDHNTPRRQPFAPVRREWGGGVGCGYVGGGVYRPLEAHALAF